MDGDGSIAECAQLRFLFGLTFAVVRGISDADETPMGTNDCVAAEILARDLISKS